MFALVLAAAASTVAATPPPDIERVIAVVEPMIRRQLKDPDSAQFDWPYNMGPYEDGNYTCLRVNSRNSFGGYTGAKWVFVGIKTNNEIRIEFEESAFWAVAYECSRAWEKGELTLRQ